MFPVCDVIPSKTRPVVTLGLIAATTLVFGYELLVGPRQLHRLAHTFGVVPAALDWPTPLTSLLLHGGWMHFAGNMLWLWLFGENVEDALGHVLFLVFYCTAGSIGALAHVALNPTSAVPLLGAGSAVAAVMGAYVALYPRSRVLVVAVLVGEIDVLEVSALFFLGLWLMIQLIAGVATGLQASDVFAAFVGPGAGFLVGIPAGLVARRTRRWEESGPGSQLAAMHR